MRHLIVLATLASATALAAGAEAQVNQLIGTPPAATNFLDFDVPLVPSGPITSTSSVFTSVGIASITQVGTFTPGDTMTPNSNVMGQALVSQNNMMAIAGPNEPLDNLGAGAGWDIVLAAPASEFGALFVDQVNQSYQVELFMGATSLGVGNFVYSGSFPNPPHYWTGSGPFDRILITHPSSTGGLGLDNFAFDVAGPGPFASYCTAKLNSLGCTPAVSATGSSSASATSGFDVQCAMVRNNKSGLLFYKVNGTQASVTFQCGTLCVGPSGIKRTPAQSAGGNPPPANDCSGLYSLDMNAFAAGLAGGNPDPGLLTPGNMVQCQWWGRDQGFASPCNTTLSDGGEYTINP